MSESGSGRTTNEPLAGMGPSEGWIALDAWPVMQWFRGRTPGDGEFRALLARASEQRCSLCISRMNLGEIYYVIAKDYGETTASLLIKQLKALSIDVVTVTDDDIDAGAVLKGRYRISYADAFAAVLSRARDAPLATGDPEFRALLSDRVLELHWMGL